MAYVTLSIDVEDGDNVWVVERRGNARLADEALAKPGMIGEEGLQCYVVRRFCYLMATVPKQ